jgi:flagellar biosynthetic protein FliR
VQEIVSALGAPRITHVLLLTTRIAAVLLLTPVLYAVAMPAMVRLLVVIALACVIALPFGGTLIAGPGDTGALAVALLQEAGIGATLGLGVLMAFAGFAVAGRLVDVQMGYGVAEVFDPLTRTRLPILSAVLGLLAVVFFFAVDGHHALLRGIGYSVERFPVGGGWSGNGAVDPLLRHAGSLFALGFALAAPIVLALLLVEFALGVVSRNLPQMNMLAMGIPLKILVGLFALSIWAAGFSAPAGRLYAGMYHAWAAWFSAGGPR